MVVEKKLDFYQIDARCLQQLCKDMTRGLDQKLFNVFYTRQFFGMHPHHHVWMFYGEPNLWGKHAGPNI